MRDSIITVQGTHLRRALASASSRLAADTILILCSIAWTVAGAQSGKQFNYFPVYAQADLPGPLNSTISVDNYDGILVSYFNVAIDKGLHYAKIAGNTVETLPDVGKFPRLGQYTGLNDNGVFVGDGWGGAFAYSDYKYYSIPRDNVTAINDNNQIAGWYTPSAAGPRGFIYTNGEYRDVIAPGGSYMTTEVYAINSRGDVAGWYLNEGNTSDCGVFIYTADGRLIYVRWDEKAGLRRDALSSQVIDALEGARDKETGHEEA